MTLAVKSSKTRRQEAQFRRRLPKFKNLPIDRKCTRTTEAGHMENRRLTFCDKEKVTS